MGKKNKKVDIKSNDYESEYGDLSEISIDTTDLAGAAEEVDEIIVEDQIQDRAEADRSRIGAAIDGMTEKRAKTRENSILELKHILQMAHGSHEDSLAGFSETLDTVLSGSLNRGGLEGAHTANVLAVMFIVLGPSEYGSYIWSQCARKLQSIGSKRDLESSKESTASGCALHAYCMGLLCCGGENNIDDIEAGLTLCQEIVSGQLDHGGATGHVTADVRTAALQGWALLISSTSTVTAAMKSSELLPHVASILAIEGGEYDVDLRNEAGQVAALICEIHANARLEAQENDEEFFGGGGDAGHLEAIRASLHRLANDSSKRLSKSAKKEQHGTFRRFLRSVDEYSTENVSELDKSTPNAIVSFSGGKVTCVTWSEFVKLASLRKCLGGGLADHFALGEVAASIMADSLEEEDVSRVKSVENRGKRSTGSREVTELRGKQRSQRQMAKDSFFEED